MINQNQSPSDALQQAALPAVRCNQIMKKSAMIIFCLLPAAYGFYWCFMKADAQQVASPNDFVAAEFMSPVIDESTRSTFCNLRFRVRQAFYLASPMLHEQDADTASLHDIAAKTFSYVDSFDRTVAPYDDYFKRLKTAFAPTLAKGMVASSFYSTSTSGDKTTLNTLNLTNHDTIVSSEVSFHWLLLRAVIAAFVISMLLRAPVLHHLRKDILGDNRRLMDDNRRLMDENRRLMEDNRRLQPVDRARGT
jgi:hypothetical protein